MRDGPLSFEYDLVGLTLVLFPVLSRDILPAVPCELVLPRVFFGAFFPALRSL